jgi:hypothetical protein
VRASLGALAGGAALALAGAPRVYDLVGLVSARLSPQFDPAHVVAMEHSPGVGRLTVAGFVAALATPALAQCAVRRSERWRRGLETALLALATLSSLRRLGMPEGLTLQVQGGCVTLAAALLLPLRGRARAARGALVVVASAALLGAMARALPGWERDARRASYLRDTAAGVAADRALDAALTSTALVLAAGLWALHAPDRGAAPRALAAMVLLAAALSHLG